jgi:DNA invertase Pin-like site-specific DNA recombinase
MQGIMTNQVVETARQTAIPPPQVGTAANYCLYARKSSEDDERQALSIDSQIKEMMLIAERENLVISEVRKESHSAKASGCRPVYNQLLQDVRAGIFAGILTWSPDRLSRNAGDLGVLVDLMDEGLLKEIRTHGQRFSNSPNEKFLLMILCSQAKLENDNRGINVKRGLKNKAELGVRPGLAPLGYYNELSHDRNKGKIVIDAMRAPIVKEMFEKVAYNGDSGRTILNWLNNDVGFTTRTGKRLALSNVYIMLKNHFYYGMFEYPFRSGNWYEGTHEPLISKDLFDKVQEQLLTTPKCKQGSKEFDFTKIFTCGACGSGVTAEEKFKDLKDGTMRRYIYYHCTGGADRNCKELYIREEDILAQLIGIIDQVDIDQLGIKDKVYKELFKYQTLVKNVFGQQGNSVLQMPQIDVRAYAKHVLKDGSKDDKRELLSCLKSKLMVKDKKIYLEQVN